MPLPFISTSHGIVPFGFFNINTDILILDKYAFFSTNFCNLIVKILGENSSHHDWQVFYFKDKKNLGDLHGAIAGKIYKGFIGSVYKLFPFPKDLNLFKQAVNGYKTQKIIDFLIKEYTKEYKIIVKLTPKEFKIGIYKFRYEVFFQLLNYIILGGYPRWEGGIVPDYVKKMMVAIDSFLLRTKINSCKSNDEIANHTRNNII